MINRYAAERLMLPRTLAELYEGLGEFLVAEEKGGGRGVRSPEIL